MLQILILNSTLGFQNRVSLALSYSKATKKIKFCCSLPQLFFLNNQHKLFFSLFQSNQYNVVEGFLQFKHAYMKTCPKQMCPQMVTYPGCQYIRFQPVLECTVCQQQKQMPYIRNTIEPDSLNLKWPYLTMIHI